MNPNQHPTANYQSHNELINEIQRLPFLEANQIQVPTAFNLADKIAKGTINSTLGVEQALYGVIVAGNEMYGIIKAVATFDGETERKEGVFLSHFGRDGQRAELICELQSDQPVLIYQNDANTSPVVSKEHFKAALDHSGQLLIEDRNSGNGTVFMGAGSMSKNASVGDYEHSNPLNKFSIWAPSSAFIKESIKSKSALIDEDQLPVVMESDMSPYEKSMRRLFAPVIRPENLVPDPGYDHLIFDDPEVQQKFQEYRDASEAILPAQREHDRYVNDGSRHYSVSKLRRAISVDRALASAIGAENNKLDQESLIQLVDELRINPELRFKAGMYLTEKMEKARKYHPERLPERVVDNRGKNMSGRLGKMGEVPSAIASAAYALEMISGCFNPELEENIFEYNSNGVATLGQHRYAAEFLLREPEITRDAFLGRLATRI